MNIPCCFITSKKDTVVPLENTKKLYSKYKGEKKLVVLEGEHNAPRDDHVIDEILKWVT